VRGDEGEGFLEGPRRDAIDLARVVPGAVMVADTPGFWSVVRIAQVDDGQVHVVAVPAAVELLARPLRPD
jgi:hypothetical protein